MSAPGLEEPGGAAVVTAAEQLTWATANQILDLVDDYADQVQRAVRAAERGRADTRDIQLDASATYKDLAHFVMRLAADDRAAPRDTKRAQAEHRE